jgi:aminobenzoyl-glutamate utilization protein B
LGGLIAAKEAMEKKNIEGTLRFFGCPAEEMLSGKVWMVREGVFNGLDACLSHHPSTMNVAKLESSNANNAVKFNFYGKTSHAAGSPDQGKSALDAVELMNIGVNYLREHIIDDARIHYTIEDGGGQPNIVPGYARSWYLIRAPERPQLESIYQRVLDIAKGASLMTDCELGVEFIKGIYNKIPNKVLCDLVNLNMRDIGAPAFSREEMDFAKRIAGTISFEEKRGSLYNSKRPDWQELMDVVMDDTLPDDWSEGKISHGSTDVADVSWQTPTLEFNTSAFVLGCPGHSWQNVALAGMGVGHRSLIFASKILASTVIDLLTRPDLLGKANNEFEERLKGKRYVSPLPDGSNPPLNQWS